MSGKKTNYDIAYMRDNVITKRVQFNRRKPEDMELLTRAESSGNFNQYVHRLIRQDLEAGKAGNEGKQPDPAE